VKRKALSLLREVFLFIGENPSVRLFERGFRKYFYGFLLWQE
jgi:hypothetical protein